MPWLAAAAPVLLPILGQILGIAGQQDAARAAKHNIQDVPTQVSTNRGSYISDGLVQIDPRISALRDSLISQYGAMFPQATTTYGNLLTQAGQNSNDYINSVVNPLKQQVSSLFGNINLGQQRRGIRGTSFGNNELLNFNDVTGRALTDATARATNESIGLQAGLEGQLLGAQGGILSGEAGLNNEALRQELAALGLGEANITQMLSRNTELNRAIGGGAAGLGAGLMGLGRMLPMLGSLTGGAAGGGGGLPSGGNYSSQG